MRGLAAAAALLLASCYEPGGQCEADAECLADQICGADGLCVPGHRPPSGIVPGAVDEGYAVAKDAILEIAAPGVLANDEDNGGDPLTAVIEPAGTTRTAAGGTIYLAADGGFRYAPLLGYVGTDTFTYRATNGVRDSEPATVSIAVGP